jgi:FecR protein
MSGNGAKRWLDGSAEPGARALRQALDEALPAAEDDAFARQRVWARVQAPWWDSSGKLVDPVARARGGWLAPLLAGAGVALVAAVTTLAAIGVLRAPGPSIVSAPRGESPGGVTAVPALPPATVALTAGPGKRARHRLARGVEVELSPRTALVPGDGEAAPEVKAGRVRFSVPHQPPGQRYSVRAGAFQVVVLGTVFEVSLENGGVGVSVESGSVEVREAASGRALGLLSSGAHWSSVEAKSAAEAQGSPRAAVNRQLARPAFRPVRKAPARRLALTGVGDPAAARTMKQADQLRLRRDPARALALYQQLVDAGGPRADVALYSIGLIEDEDLHDPRRAAVTWQRYRERYPQGLLRVEADVSLIEVFTRLGESGRALAEARAFLQNHPRSERRGEVARVAGDLARREGDCLAALGFYDRAIAALAGSPQTEDHDDALFYRAECLSSGRDSRAAAAVRKYLGEFPLGRHAVEAQQLLRSQAGQAGRR